MPSRDRAQLRTAKSQAVKPVGSKTKTRKLTFETQPWYAEAARRFSAARKQDDLQYVLSEPLASD